MDPKDQAFILPVSEKAFSIAFYLKSQLKLITDAEEVNQTIFIDASYSLM